MKIYAIVTGDRYAHQDDWSHVIATALADHDVTAVVHGDARGIDAIAADVAGGMGVEVIAFPADWNKHGKGAGPIRNTQMLDYLRDQVISGNAGIVLAFHPDISSSKGTKNMAGQAKRAGIQTIVYDGRNSAQY